MVVFVARVGLVESLQVAVDSPPGPLLLVRVLNQGNLLSTMIEIMIESSLQCARCLPLNLVRVAFLLAFKFS